MSVTTPLIAIDLTLEDGTSYRIHEGDIINGITFMKDNQEYNLSGSARVINVATSAYSAGPDECPPEPFFAEYARINSIILDYSDAYDAKLISIPIEGIIAISSVETPDPNAIEVNPNDPDSMTISEAIEIAEDGATIQVAEGDLTDELTIEKSVTLKGASAGIAQNHNQEV